MSATARPRRSALYLPASNPRALAKARTLACDVVILDLEDAVAPEAKRDARTAAAAAIRGGGWGGRETVVRINAAETPWHEDDLAMVASVGPDAVLLPKVRARADVEPIVSRLGGVAAWAMVETPAALFALDALAATPGIDALVIGTNDLAAGLRMRPGPDRQPLQAFLAFLVAAARTHGIAALDGVFTHLRDPARLARECAQGLAFGFDGKTLIHPDQIAAANTAFSPDAAAVAAARRIVAGFAAAPDAGVLRVDDRMVERLHLDEARRTLALAEAIRDRE